MRRVPTGAGLALAAAAVGLLAACGDQGPSADAVARARLCDFDTERPAVTVTPGPEPTISWSPPCRMSELLVYDPATTGPGAPPPATFREWFMWYLVDSSTAEGRRGTGFPPPVRYGVRAPGTREALTPRPLAAGVRYPLQLWVWTGNTTLPLSYGEIAP